MKIEDYALKFRQREVAYKLREVLINGDWHPLNDVLSVMEDLNDENSIWITKGSLEDALIAIGAATSTYGGGLISGPEYKDFFGRLILLSSAKVWD